MAEIVARVHTHTHTHIYIYIYIYGNLIEKENKADNVSSYIKKYIADQFK